MDNYVNLFTKKLIYNEFCYFEKHICIKQSNFTSRLKYSFGLSFGRLFSLWSYFLNCFQFDPTFRYIFSINSFLLTPSKSLTDVNSNCHMSFCDFFDFF